MLHLAIRRGVAQSGRALGSGPRGRWFESSRPDQNFLRKREALASRFLFRPYLSSLRMGAHSLAIGYRGAVGVREIHVKHLVGLPSPIASHRYVNRPGGPTGRDSHCAGGGVVVAPRRSSTVRRAVSNCDGAGRHRRDRQKEPGVRRASVAFEDGHITA